MEALGVLLGVFVVAGVCVAIFGHAIRSGLDWFADKVREFIGLS